MTNSISDGANAGMSSRTGNAQTNKERDSEIHVTEDHSAADQLTNGSQTALTEHAATAEHYLVCAFYKFVELPDYKDLQPKLKKLMNQHQVRGTILLAEEGINGTISGHSQDVEEIMDWLSSDSRLDDIDAKTSLHHEPPFLRTKVKLKKEIVSLGVPEANPTKHVGTYIEPKDWNRLLADPDVLLIDTRNKYEVQIGSFKGAINPNTETFRDFPQYVETELDAHKDKEIAMFCTGGIRCEKSTSLLKSLGFDKVYHLKGGILNYLEKVTDENSLWQGECFVFDDRVAVDKHLNKGQYDQCHACRRPITETDKAQPSYVAGVSCLHCVQNTTDAQKQRYAERQKQMQFARVRGQQHIGGDVQKQISENRALKLARKSENTQ
jgi:UPF0176 protein